MSNNNEININIYPPINAPSGNFNYKRATEYFLFLIEKKKAEIDKKVEKDKKLIPYDLMIQAQLINLIESHANSTK